MTTSFQLIIHYTPIIRSYIVLVTVSAVKYNTNKIEHAKGVSPWQLKKKNLRRYADMQQPEKKRVETVAPIRDDNSTKNTLIWY
jgi:hypothetical protein